MDNTNQKRVGRFISFISSHLSAAVLHQLPQESKPTDQDNMIFLPVNWEIPSAPLHESQNPSVLVPTAQFSRLYVGDRKGILPHTGYRARNLSVYPKYTMDECFRSTN